MTLDAPNNPEFVQAQIDWQPLVHGEAIGIGNALNLDADGVHRVKEALNRARIAGYCRARGEPTVTCEQAETRLTDAVLKDLLLRGMSNFFRYSDVRDQLLAVLFPHDGSRLREISHER